MKRYLAVFVLALPACGGDSSNAGPPTGKNGRAVSSPCDGGSLILLQYGKLTCEYGFPQPEFGDDRFWPAGAEKPCSRRIDAPDRAPDSHTYEYNENDAYRGASYDDSGNIVSWNALELIGEELVINYEYEDGQLVGANINLGAQLGGVKRFAYTHDDDGRREKEVEVGGSGVYYYGYEDGRWVVAGPPVKGAPPVRYEESFLAPDANGAWPIVPPLDVVADGIDGATAPHWAFFYDGDRLKAAGRGGAPGLPFSKLSYEYEGDRLASMKVDGEGRSINPLLQPATWTYDYTCP